MFCTRFFSLSLSFTVLRDEFRLEPQNTRVALGDVAIMECGPPRGTPEPVSRAIFFLHEFLRTFFAMKNWLDSGWL